MSPIVSVLAFTLSVEMCLATTQLWCLYWALFLCVILSCLLVLQSYNFDGAVPFCIEAWVKPFPKDAGLGVFGGTIISKYNRGVSGQFFITLENTVRLPASQVAEYKR